MHGLRPGDQNVAVEQIANCVDASRTARRPAGEQSGSSSISSGSIAATPHLFGSPSYGCNMAGRATAERTVREHLDAAYTQDYASTAVPQPNRSGMFQVTDGMSGARAGATRRAA